MKSPYKNFIVFKHNQKIGHEVNKLFGTDWDFEMHEHRDPTGGQWKNSGIAHVEHEKFYLELGTGAFLMHVQFNERILPSKVRDEETKKMAAAQEERTGRKTSKKEFRMLRDEAEQTLLPKAFIRRTVIPVIFYEDRLFVFTSSLLKSDSVTAVLINIFDGLVLFDERPLGKMNFHLTNCLNDGGPFEAGSYAKFKGEGADRKSVAVKDLDLGSVEVVKLRKQGYQVDDIELVSMRNDEVRYSFKLNSKFIFRGFTIPNANAQMDDEETGSWAYLSIKYANEAFETLMTTFDEESASDFDDGDEVL